MAGTHERAHAPQKPALTRAGQNPALARDAALGRVSRTRRWLIAAAAALTAGLAAMASALLPGKSLGAKARSARTATTRVAAAPSPTPQLPAPADAGQLGLQSPGQAPEAVPAPQPAAPAPQPQAATPAPAPSGGAVVVSGGS